MLNYFEILILFQIPGPSPSTDLKGLGYIDLIRLSALSLYIRKCAMRTNAYAKFEFYNYLRIRFFYMFMKEIVILTMKRLGS